MDGEDSQRLLVGNRVVLLGAVLYLLEWVAIFVANVSVPLGADATGSELISGYVGHEDALGWAAGWFSVVLLGRILIVTGLRSALADSGRRQPLMDFATAAMAVGVGLEVATYGIVAGTSWAGAHGATTGELRMLDAVGFAPAACCGGRPASPSCAAPWRCGARSSSRRSWSSSASWRGACSPCWEPSSSRRGTSTWRRR